MGCVTPVSILAILAIIFLATGQWGLGIVCIVLAIPAGVISTTRKSK